MKPRQDKTRKATTATITITAAEAIVTTTTTTTTTTFNNRFHETYQDNSCIVISLTFTQQLL